MTISQVRVSEKGRDQLIKLKRVTRLKQWNELCRWALCASLAEPSIPPNVRIATDSSVEMDWTTFGGRQAAVYLALLQVRCMKDGLGTDSKVVAQQFRLHLHRGIGYLAADKKSRDISAFFSKMLAEKVS